MEHNQVIYGKNSITENTSNGWFIDRFGKTNYTLKSDHSRTVKVPFNVAKKASKLINFVLEAKTLGELRTRVHEDPCLHKVYVPEKADCLIGKGKKVGSKQSRKTIDEVYLSACIHMCDDQLASMDGEGKQSYEHRALERYNTIKNKQYLEGVLESL